MPSFDTNQGATGSCLSVSVRRIGDGIRARCSMVCSSSDATVDVFTASDTFFVLADGGMFYVKKDNL